MLYRIIIVLTLLCSASLNGISYNYDSLNRLDSVDYENGYAIQYTYDNNGNITSCIQSIPNAAPLSPQFVTISQSANQIEDIYEITPGVFSKSLGRS